MKSFLQYLRESNQQEETLIREMVRRRLIDQQLADQAKRLESCTCSPAQSLGLLLQDRATAISKRIQSATNGMDAIRLMDAKQNILLILGALALTRSSQQSSPVVRSKE